LVAAGGADGAACAGFLQYPALMVELLQAIAVRLRPLVPLSLAVTLAGLGLFAASALMVDGDAWLVAGLLAALWGGWLFALLTGFRVIPPAADVRQSLGSRLRLRLARAGYVALAWALLAAALVAGFVTFRLVTLGVG
jgi:hypothetical protein